MPHGSTVWLKLALALVASVCLLSSPAAATGKNAGAQTIWRLLDYMAVDYGGAVADGRVTNAAEYAEMTEFAAEIVARLGALPADADRAALIDRASQLQNAVASKRPPDDVAALALGLAADLLRVYPVPLAPTKAPDLTAVSGLFAQGCASCHGANGNGRGPDAASLAVPPIAFTDVERARQRSVFALYQVISQGIEGTAMQSFADLPNDQRWALAFRAGSFAFTDAQAAEGERLWKSDAGLRTRIPDLRTLVALTPAALADRIGPARADAVLAYLRRRPEQVTRQAPGSLAVARAKLAQSVAAARRGDRRAAKELALSAYLDGFEPVEPILSARNGALMGRIEGAMGEYRAAIDRGASPDDLAAKAAVLSGLLIDVEDALAPDTTTQFSTFLGAFTILLREGLEALLVVVAMIAFVRKAERPEELRYVHGGWIGALVAGALTWVVATYAIGISGAGRELTEGFGSLLAAVVLLSVGIWMHGKSQADQWQRYIRDRMSRALSRGSGWFLFGLAFVAVYREVFETILFYAALSAQGNNGMLLAGAGAAIGLLGLIAWAMLRYSRQLPITQFFRYSSWLMAGLTIVLAGKGVAALQEAGMIDISPLADVPRLSMLGLFPTTQSVLAQLLMAVAIGIGFAWNGWKETAGRSRRD
ncbi:MAG: cytochrome c/FTR1 family iron permease [Qipengyuania sp.]|nr:cytochrome c/FTR1 family iron permease [Qipengyuania sp.]